ncbi:MULTISPECIES: N-6 DNA methylase [unclassified Streptomyces]|uniref:N-6 DNA methylase n=1 Tax=unclassified Streptomyces TaxID=2593676 RepID=UPI002E134F92|nr:SAM-dependent methyltransferase [Streptomyces sp. NBC_01197]WSS48996.1 SAM-dependent methyltransferase [Streptomyces sp. NBC_01180]
MSQLDLFADDDTPGEPPAPPAPAAPPRKYLTDLPPAPTPVTVSAKARPKLATVKTKLSHYRPSLGSPHATAFDIAEAVSYAWHHAQGGAGIEVPMGVVATLALWPLRGPDAYLAADWWLSLDDDQLLTAFRECWARWWIMRPDLIDRATPLHKWVDDEEPGPNRARAVRAVVEAALTRGLLHLTSSDDPDSRSTTDVMGTLLAVMRSQGAHDALAEVHTPPEVAYLMARMLLDDTQLQPGMKFDEPAGGTGGMYRAAAQVMREKGIDPHDFGWSLTDIDELAAAGAAVNAIIWDLGPSVLIACGDTLHDGNLPAKAAQQALDSFARRDELHSQAVFLAALQKVETLVRGIAA